MNKKTAFRLFAVLILGLSILVLDAYSKWLINRHIPLMTYGVYPFGGIGIFKNFLGIQFSITHIINRGAAWGVFADHQESLLAIRIFLICALSIYMASFCRQFSKIIPLVLIIAGAIGNVLDYFIYGYVVDMFFFSFWGNDFAIFNVADSAVTIGVCWLFLESFFSDKDAKKDNFSMQI